MAARKKTRRKTPAKRKTTTTRRRRSTTSTARRRRSPSKIVNLFVPLFFIICILFCLGFLMFMGYRTATASAFFEMENIELRGVQNIREERIRQIVREKTAQTGVWNADLEAIKREIENFRYAGEVSVSRVLPDTIRVIVSERKRVAVIRLDGKDYWADAGGLILERVSAEDKRPPFTMFGWDEKDGEKAAGDNKKRVALYLQLIEEWKQNDLAARVKAVDLGDLRDAKAIIEDSGRTVRISLGKEDFGKRLQRGIENTAGRGEEIEAIIMDGVNPVISYRNS